MSNKGILYGIGVGPGDASLLTIKAIETIKKSDILILPAKDKESCRAYNIVSQVVDGIDDKECMFEPFPMTMNKEELHSFHMKVADKIAAQLNEGRSVAFLTIGDPAIYSTYEYIDRIVREKGYLTERVSGITSFLEVAARLNISLAIEDTPIHIVPGSADFEKMLKLDGTKVFMKSGKRIANYRSKLIEHEKLTGARVMSISNCGMENEVVAYKAEDIPENGSYMTVIFVMDK